MHKSPIFICGNLKSGTTLLQSLFDGHPELFVIPTEIKLFKFLDLPSLPPGNMPPPSLGMYGVPMPRLNTKIDDIRKELLDHSDFKQLLNEEFKNRGINIPYEIFNKEKFEEIIHGSKISSPHELYELVLKAFFYSFSDKRDINTIRFLEKTPHIEEYAVELKKWYPGAKFVHVLRNPYANVYSLAKGTRITRDIREGIYRPMMKSFYFLERNQRYINNYYVVKYEDIVSNTEITLQNLASKLEIPFVESLLQPTFCGDLWSGNSRSTIKKFKGISKRPLEKYKANLHTLHIEIINRFFYNFMVKYDYKIHKSKKFKKWLPVGIEHPMFYLKNRNTTNRSYI